MWGASEGSKQGKTDENITISEIQVSKCTAGKWFSVTIMQYVIATLSRAETKQHKTGSSTEIIASGVFLIPTNDMLDCKVERRKLLQRIFIINKKSQGEIKSCLSWHT